MCDDAGANAMRARGRLRSGLVSDTSSRVVFTRSPMRGKRSGGRQVLILYAQTVDSQACAWAHPNCCLLRNLAHSSAAPLQSPSLSDVGAEAMP